MVVGGAGEEGLVSAAIMAAAAAAVDGEEGEEDSEVSDGSIRSCCFCLCKCDVTGFPKLNPCLELWGV